MKMPAGPAWLEMCAAADKALIDERVDDALELPHEAPRLNPRATEALPAAPARAQGQPT